MPLAALESRKTENKTRSLRRKLQQSKELPVPEVSAAGVKWQLKIYFTTRLLLEAFISQLSEAAKNKTIVKVPIRRR